MKLAQKERMLLGKKTKRTLRLMELGMMLVMDSDCILVGEMLSLEKSTKAFCLMKHLHLLQGKILEVSRNFRA